MVSFIGVMLIIQPEFIFGESAGSSSRSEYFTVFVACMILVALGHATNMHLIFTLSKKAKVHPFINLYYSHLGHVFVNGIMNNFYPKTIPSSSFTFGMVLTVLAVTVSTLIAQGGIVLASSIKSPSLVMPFGYVGVLVGFVADRVLFGTSFTLLPILGILMTSSGLLSGYLLSRNHSDDLIHAEVDQHKQ